MDYPFLNLQHVTQSQRTELDAAIAKVLDHSHYLYGPEVGAFEEAFAAWLDVPHCVGAANGTAALEMAVRALGIGPGDEVVTQTNTFAASGLAILSVGATPVFVDCDGRGRMDLDQAFEACRRPKVKALMVVHLYGECVDMDRVTTECAELGVALIEDCAQSHGTAWKGRKVGTFGQIGCFSFYPGKNLGACGDAGALVTSDPELARLARIVGGLGAETKYVHIMPGINSRMDTLQAAILGVKLPLLDEWNEARRRVASWYEAELDKCLTVALLQPPSLTHPSMTHTYHLLVLRLIESVDRETLMEKLRSKGVGCLIHYPHPCHTMGAFQDRSVTVGPLTTSQALATSMLSLPIHPYLTREDVKTICNRLKECFN